MDNEKSYGCIMTNTPMHADENNSCEAEAGVTIPHSALRQAAANAEQAADDIQRQIKTAEAERDNLVRRVGSLQREIDTMMAERNARTHHVRTLLAAIS